jgi:hypothetical protein
MGVLKKKVEKLQSQLSLSELQLKEATDKAVDLELANLELTQGKQVATRSTKTQCDAALVTSDCTQTVPTSGKAVEVQFPEAVQDRGLIDSLNSMRSSLAAMDPVTDLKKKMTKMKANYETAIHTERMKAEALVKQIERKLQEDKDNLRKDCQRVMCNERIKIERELQTRLRGGGEQVQKELQAATEQWGAGEGTVSIASLVKHVHLESLLRGFKARVPRPCLSAVFTAWRRLTKRKPVCRVAPGRKIDPKAVIASQVKYLFGI